MQLRGREKRDLAEAKLFHSAHSLRAFTAASSPAVGGAGAGPGPMQMKFNFPAHSAQPDRQAHLQ